MIEKDAYKAEKEARERRLMAYSDRIQNRMMEASSEIIDELVAERHRQNVTQQELADMTGILPSNLARFEKAARILYIPLSVSMLHGHLVHGFRPLSASIPVC